MSSMLGSSLILSAVLMSFSVSNGIEPCYLTFSPTSDLTSATPEQLPGHAPKTRVLNTDQGEKTVTRQDGYRILYNNAHGATFVNIKVERSQQGSYAADTAVIVSNLEYMIAHSPGMESDDALHLNLNGRVFHGLSRKDIGTASTLGTFVLFPGNDLTVYFYFNDMEPEHRNFKNVEDYKRQRDAFLGAYAEHLNTCRKK